MSERALLQTSNNSTLTNVEASDKGKDWLANASFGEAFKRSIYLLQHQFRWLVSIFFLGGFGLSIILLPVNSVIATVETGIANEIFAPVPDLMRLMDLLVASMTWGFVQKFVLSFGTFILGALAVHHVFNSVPSLQLLVSDNRVVRFPHFSIIAAAFLTSISLTFASVLPIIVPFLQALFFFLPVLLVLGQFSLTQSFSLSVGMRVQHWRRILGAIILGYLLILFAGALGLTLYRDIEVVLGLYGISLGLTGPILQSILTQIPIAMVAPLLPLFSVTFFTGARGAYREKQYYKFKCHQEKQPPQRRFIPLKEPLKEAPSICQHCSNPLKQGNIFCTQCGHPS